MENKVNRISRKQQNPAVKNKASLQQLSSFPKTPKLTIQPKPTFQNLKVCESTIVLAQNSTAPACQKCKNHQQKLSKLRTLQQEVSYLRERNSEIKEQIELLSNNFMYILELASENIIRGAKQKVKKIVATKQNLIEKQSQVIKRLENQSEVLIDKVDAGLENSQKIVELEQKVKLLEVENKQLREVCSKKLLIEDESISFFRSSTDVCTLESGDKSPKQPWNANMQINSARLDSFNNPEIASPKIKKRKTLEMDQFSGENSNIKSIKSLKMKINIIKQKLTNQKL